MTEERDKQRRRAPVEDREGEDGGFSLIETMVSIALFAIVLMGTIAGTTGALFSSLSSREHSVATSLVTQTVSQAEALSFASLQAGVYQADLAGDGNVTSSSGVYYLTLNGAAIAACAGSTADPPLVPHVTTVVLGITYHVAAYPTVANPTCGSNPTLVTLVVVVSWTTPSGGKAQVVGEQAIAAP